MENDSNKLKNYQTNDKLKISGSIGLVHLKNKEKMKNVYIYYDDHSNKNYCSSNDSIFLYDLFENIIKDDKDHIILLEEPFVNNYSNIKFLWNDTPHVIKFRNFYKKIIKKCSESKICYIYPIDIRLIICDVSIDELLLNIEDPQYFEKYDITTAEYFKYILYIFDYIEYNEELFVGCDKNIIFIKKVFSTHLDCEYYKKLKEEFEIFYNNFIEPNKLLKIYDFLIKYKQGFYSFSSGYPFKNLKKDDFLDQYDKLINGIMEYYTFILITGLGNKNISVYSGYYHSNNLTYILNNYYNYDKVYQIGNTENIEDIDDKNIKNCLFINKNIFNN
jgi:hypothetical protein